MGQRHQVFLVVRVHGRHRCIAAFHSQWLYGRAVVYAAARVARALVDPINAAAIASELATLDELEIDAIANQDNDDYDNPAILCPYLTALFLTSSRLDNELGRLYKMNLEHMYCLPSQCDNDDGFTCFDVTEQGKPRYCFWWREAGQTFFCAYHQFSPLSYSVDRDKPFHPNAIAILGHFPLLERTTLSAVWPQDFADIPGAPPGIGAASPFYSPLAHSAETSLKAIKTPHPTYAGPLIEGLLVGLSIVFYAAEARRRRWYERRESGQDDDGSEPSDIAAVPSPSAIAAASAIKDILYSDRELGWPIIKSALENLVIGPGNLEVLRTELMAVKSLNRNGFILLKQLLTAEKAKIVDLKHWLSTGAIDASMLLDLVDALQHAECLDLSFSSTLTAEIVETMVPRLPNLRHLVAFSCKSLGPLTTALPLTTYLASLPLLEAVNQNRLVIPGSSSPPECLRWVEESDAPAGLSVVLLSPSLSLLDSEPHAARRYGVELGHFGVAGVVSGLAFFLDHLYDPEYRPADGACYFEMRAYFHATDLVPTDQCVVESFDYTWTHTFGCLPSLIKDVSAADGQVYPKMEISAASDSLTRVPRYPGWVLVLDTKGTIPYHQLLKSTGMTPRELLRQDIDRAGMEVVARDIPLEARGNSFPDDTIFQPVDDYLSQFSINPWKLDPTTPPRRMLVTVRKKESSPSSSAPAPRAVVDRFRLPSPPPPDHVPTPEYAFERWDVIPGEEEKGLQPVERLSVREWVGRLPAGHGAVDKDTLVYCELVLARLHPP
ncbi:hypothetical protein AURDEDRAFT_188643 [Auricularia subglabra TFB-10046 SS5]|nr:hypothetical protein AURDEDRAFT_188643 [Auricularia subglabra TFB-10046 SS5]